MFERRLYHHIDWLLIGAVLAICADRPGDDLQHHRRRQPHLLDAGLRARPRPDRDGRLPSASTIDRSPTSRTGSILAMMILLVGVLFFGSVRGGSRRWIDLGLFNLQPSEFAKATARADARQDARRRAAAAPSPTTICFIAGVADGGAVPHHRAPARSRHRRDAAADPAGRGLRRRHADEIHLRHADRRRARGAGRLQVRAAGLSARTHFHLPRPGAGPQGRRLPADPGPHHRRLRRRVGQRLHAGHAGPVAVPAGRAQRLHLLGARRGAGVGRCARRPRACTCS